MTEEITAGWWTEYSKRRSEALREKAVETCQMKSLIPWLEGQGNSPATVSFFRVALEEREAALKEEEDWFAQVTVFVTCKLMRKG